MTRSRLAICTPRARIHPEVTVASARTVMKVTVIRADVSIITLYNTYVATNKRQRYIGKQLHSGARIGKITVL